MLKVEQDDFKGGGSDSYQVLKGFIWTGATDQSELKRMEKVKKASKGDKLTTVCCRDSPRVVFLGKRTEMNDVPGDKLEV